MSVNSSGHEVLSTYNVLPEKELEESASADFAPYGREISQVAPKGTFTGKILFILVKFNDRGNYYSAAKFATLLKSNIKAYYSKASYGKVTLNPAAESHGTANDGVVGWIKLNRNHPNTQNNSGNANALLTKQAILAANKYVNFAAYDTNGDGYVDSHELAVVVIVAGWEYSYGGAAYTPSV